MQHKDFFWNLGFQTIQELETEKGILASGREEIYGCIFGRDSLITALKLLDLDTSEQGAYFLPLVKKVLHHLCVIQGKEVNIESGEEPGKCIHEFRPERHEHLTGSLDRPWYLYPDNVMRNFDSVDATELFLIAMYRYWQKSKDDDFVYDHTFHIESALRWILTYGDKNKDGFVDYELPEKRKYGGLKTQSWMDSAESVFHEDKTPIAYPIAPVEVQAYSYLAMSLWSRYFYERHPEFSEEISVWAKELKKTFNGVYIFEEKGETIFSCGIDGAQKPLTSLCSSIGHCLWASLTKELDGGRDCIVDEARIPALVVRLMQPDIFEPNAGIRTLSKYSRCFIYNSYHNGSIWPHDNGMVIEGFEQWGYAKEAQQVRKALAQAFAHFQTPIELFAFSDEHVYEFFISPTGQMSCKKQAWSAATMLKVSKYV